MELGFFFLQIELLCRRANFDAKETGSRSKIYCLAYIDLLGYEAAAFAEKCIEQFCFNIPG